MPLKEHEILSALQPFTDPATEIRKRDMAGSLSVRFVRNAVQYSIRVDLASGLVEIETPTDRKTTFHSLLASADFANLDAMTGHQIRLLAGVNQNFIEQRLEIDDRNRGLDEFMEMLDAPSTDATRIVVLDGPAGIGKTHLLRRACAKQADRFRSRTSERAFLYVSSRGRRLSRLTDVIAASTQDVRAAFTYHQVPALVRLGLLSLVIDGFDELVNADGYEDAWTTLRDFLEELDGKGLVLLAGRDTFFDEQSFYTRLESAHERLSVTLAHLQPPNWPDARNWLATQGWTDQRLKELEFAFEPGRRTYALRPYFLTEIAKLDVAELGVLDFRSVVVEKFVRREAAIVRGITRGERNVEFALNETFKAIALEMLERELEVIDNDFIAIAMDYAFQNAGFDRQDRDKLVHKAASTGFLEEDSSSRKRRQFPHAEIFHFFLSEALLDALASPTYRYLLRKSVLSLDLLDVLADRVEERTADAVGSLWSEVSKAIQEERTDPYLTMNAGAFLLALARSTKLERTEREISVPYIAQGSLAAASPVLVLKDVRFAFLDATGAELHHVRFEDVRCDSLDLDEGTRFGSTLPDAVVVREKLASGVRVLRDRTLVRAALSNRQTESKEADDLPLVRYVKDIALRATRHFYIHPDPDETKFPQIRDARWPGVRDLLESHGLLVRKSMSMHGVAAQLMHIRNPSAILQGESADPAEDARIKTFWKELESMARA